jgi:hypothetical protein
MGIYPDIVDFLTVVARSGFVKRYDPVLVAGAKVEERSDEIPPWRGKNRDKQLTHIVRVSISCKFCYYIIKSKFTPDYLGV